MAGLVVVAVTAEMGGCTRCPKGYRPRYRPGTLIYANVCPLKSTNFHVYISSRAFRRWMNYAIVLTDGPLEQGAPTYVVKEVHHLP